MLRSDGTLTAWGDSFYGVTSIPAAATNIIAIAAGFTHNLALRADGLVLAWGENYAGATTVPPDLTNIVGIAADTVYPTAWTPLPLVPGNGRTLILIDPEPSGPHRFYRVREW